MTRSSAAAEPSSTRSHAFKFVPSYLSRNFLIFDTNVPLQHRIRCLNYVFASTADTIRQLHMWPSHSLSEVNACSSSSSISFSSSSSSSSPLTNSKTNSNNNSSSNSSNHHHHPNSAIVAPYSPDRLTELRLITDPLHPAHGQFGLFAKQQISSGTLIGPYTGMIQVCHVATSSRTYAMGFGSESADFMVDGEFFGNLSRFANDPRGTNKPPNCAAESRFNAMGELFTGLIARRTIAAGDEILMDYGRGFCMESQQWRSPKGGLLVRSRRKDPIPLPIRIEIPTPSMGVVKTEEEDGGERKPRKGEEMQSRGVVPSRKRTVRSSDDANGSSSLDRPQSNTFSDEESTICTTTQQTTATIRYDLYWRCDVCHSWVYSDRENGEVSKGYLVHHEKLCVASVTLPSGEGKQGERSTQLSPSPVPAATVRLSQSSSLSSPLADDEASRRGSCCRCGTSIAPLLDRRQLLAKSNNVGPTFSERHNNSSTDAFAAVERALPRTVAQMLATKTVNQSTFAATTSGPNIVPLPPHSNTRETHSHSPAFEWRKNGSSSSSAFSSSCATNSTSSSPITTPATPTSGAKLAAWPLNFPFVAWQVWDPFVPLDHGVALNSQYRHQPHITVYDDFEKGRCVLVEKRYAVGAWVVFAGGVASSVPSSGSTSTAIMRRSERSKEEGDPSGLSSSRSNRATMLARVNMNRVVGWMPSGFTKMWLRSTSSQQQDEKVAPPRDELDLDLVMSEEEDDESDFDVLDEPQLCLHVLNQAQFVQVVEDDVVSMAAYGERTTHSPPPQPPSSADESKAPNVVMAAIRDGAGALMVGLVAIRPIKEFDSLRIGKYVTEF